MSTALFTAILQGCATQLIAVGDWGRTPDLHLDSETLKDVRVKVSCHRLNPKSGSLQPRRYQLCQTLERQISTLGAEVVDPDAEANYSLQFVELGGTEDGVSAVSFIASALTGWLVPYIATGRVARNFAFSISAACKSTVRQW